MTFYEKQYLWRKAISNNNPQQRNDSIEITPNNNDITTYLTPNINSTVNTPLRLDTEQVSVTKQGNDSNRSKLSPLSRSNSKTNRNSSASDITASSTVPPIADDLSILHDTSRSFYMNDHNFHNETIPISENANTDEESIVEVLERERREWHHERVKLVHCIHMQQLELAQRSVVAHDRAVDIAKEFARTIEAFEERMLGVEETVQRELISVRTATEALQAAVAALIANGTVNNSPHNQNSNDHQMKSTPVNYSNVNFESDVKTN